MAFTATLTHDVSLGPQQTIEYDKILTNVGNSYESRDGHFNAPVNGVYIISATVCTTASQTHAEIVKNGVQLAAMYGDDYDLTSHTIVITLNINDRVWVRHTGDGNEIRVVKGTYSSFSGALIALL